MVGGEGACLCLWCRLWSCFWMGVFVVRLACVADGVGFFLRRGGALTVGKGGPE